MQTSQPVDPGPTAAAFAALDLAHDALEAALRGVAADQWSRPTACAEWDVRQVANHIVAAGDYLMALLRGVPREEALGFLLVADVLGPDPVGAFVAQRPKVRAAYHAPGALTVIGHHVITDMTGEQLLGGCIVETAVHALDIARATATDLVLDPALAATALGVAEVIGPVFAAHGFAAPAVEVAPSAPAQDRLLAVLGRQP